jgi:RimJ/RimL family protein N-acetyltransferase
VRLVKRAAFERQNAHRLWLDVLDFNVRARRLYETEGFVVEGTRRDCLRRGDRYVSAVIMSMLESEYRSERQIR